MFKNYNDSLLFLSYSILLPLNLIFSFNVNEIYICMLYSLSIFLKYLINLYLLTKLKLQFHIWILGNLDSYRMLYPDLNFGYVSFYEFKS